MPSSLVAIGTAVSEWWAGTSLAGVASFAARTLLTIGITKLIANKAGDTGAGTTANGGGRIQLPPGTDNMIPVVYGSAFVAPVLTDAKISSDNKTMWYVCALSEVTDTGTISFGQVYYDGKLCTFDSVDYTKVISLTTNASPAQEDSSCSGSLYIYGYSNGSSSPTNSSQTAIQVLQDAGIPVDYRWTSTDLMSNTAFIIVKIIYNQNSGLTNLGQIQVQVNNSLTKPGDVINDYLQNTRYGCAIPSSQIDSASITALNTYSDVSIPYTPVGGGSASQARYRINGIINTGNNCMTNLQQLVDACDSWLQYSELTGKWKFVINESYEQKGQSLSDLFLIDSSNLVGGIDIQPLDLNGTYNQMEIQYPNQYVRDQTDFINLDLRDLPEADLMSPNEPVNKLTVQLPQVNNYVQAYYLGARRILQSREDLTITCNLDFSGIQIEAGDVVRVTLAEYGWDQKLFRVSQVQESKDNIGNLGSRITAFEYNSTIYTNDAINDFRPADNTGLTDPNILTAPGTPTIATSSLLAGNLASFVVTTTVPTSGQTLYLDFNYGTSSTVSSHKLYRTVTDTSGTQFTPGATITVTVNDLPANTYYFSVKARNKVQGRSSASSSGYVWNGMNITDATTVIKSGASSTGTTVYVSDTTGIVPGQQVTQSAGSGLLQAGTLVLAVQAGKLLLSKLPSTPLTDAVLKFFGGGVKPSQLGNGLGGYNFDSALVSDNFEAPALVTTSTEPNHPFILPGTSVSSTLLWPWQQGTSSTSDGYFADSTGPYSPVEAKIIQPWTQGDYDWYWLFLQDLHDSPVSPNSHVQVRAMIQVITDTDDTTFQVAPVSDVANPDFVIDTQYIRAFNVPYAGSYAFSYAINDIIGVDEAVTLFGYTIRNITAGSNLTVVSVKWTVTEVQGTISFPGF